MTQQQLNNSLTSQLKDFLRKRKHIESGDLYKSIKVSSDANLNFKLNAYEYIQYLDDGTFLSDFFALPKTVQTIQTFLTSSLDKEFDKPL